MIRPSHQSVTAARDRLAPHLIATPVCTLADGFISRTLGGNVHLKLELLQHTGTFKFRGALNNLLQSSISPHGITAVSAGNHAVAVACAAQRLSIDAKIVLQRSANPARRALAEGYGAELLIAEDGPAAFAEAERLVNVEERTMIHPFDGPHVADATAVLGWEMLDSVPDLDAVVVSVGGGGLAGGLARGIKLRKPDCLVFGVEPAGAQGMRASFDAQHAVSDVPIDTVADSLGPPLTTDYTYALCQENLDALVSVADRDILSALYLLFAEAKLAVEPAGAAALAGALGPLRAQLTGHTIGIVICGSCIDAAGYETLLRRGEQAYAASLK